MTAIALLVTGVLAAVATVALSGLFGRSTKGGYLWRGSWTTKDMSYVLRGLKILAAGIIATYLWPVIAGMAPWIVAIVVVGGLVLVVHYDIDHWRLW